MYAESTFPQRSPSNGFPHRQGAELALPFGFLWRHALRDLAVLCITVFLCAGATAQDKTAPEKEPGPDATGKVYTWQYEDGLRFEYYLPKKYDPKAPIALTFILHGSNLNHRWGFWNHKAGEFRANDLVVSPNGTTPMETEDSTSCKVVATWRACTPCTNASKNRLPSRRRTSMGTARGPSSRCCMPANTRTWSKGWSRMRVVRGSARNAAKKITTKQSYTCMAPWTRWFHSAKAWPPTERTWSRVYPLARLRVLQDYNHWPAQLQTDQALTWCEVMTSEDKSLAREPFERLLELTKEGGLSVDYGALYQAAQSLGKERGKQAEAVIVKINKMAEAHHKAILKSLGKAKPKQINGKPWSGHARYFLREFQGTPAALALEKEWGQVRKAQSKALSKAGQKYYQQRSKSPAKAIEPCAEILSQGYLLLELENVHWQDNLSAWLKDAEELGLHKKRTKELQAVLDDWQSAQDKGRKAYLKISKRL